MLQEAELSGKLIQERPRRFLGDEVYYVGLDFHKKTISYCVKDAAGCMRGEGELGLTRSELEARITTLPQPRTIDPG